MKKIAFALFALMCLLQWYIPIKMIYDQEDILQNGTAYKFKTQPIDPTDPFRGSYITLNFEANSIPVKNYKEWSNNDLVFASLKKDSMDYAWLESVSNTIPQGHDYIKAKIDYVDQYEPYSIRLALPFDRFYLEEYKAPKAERVYWDAQRNNSAQVAYAIIYVKNGEASLKDVMINDRSIIEIVKEVNSK